VEVTVKDYASPVKPTWCPGCGDYSILAAVKQALVQVGLARTRCSSSAASAAEASCPTMST